MKFEEKYPHADDVEFRWNNRDAVVSALVMLGTFALILLAIGYS